MSEWRGRLTTLTPALGRWKEDQEIDDRMYKNVHWSGINRPKRPGLGLRGHGKSGEVRELVRDGKPVCAEGEKLMKNSKRVGGNTYWNQTALVLARELLKHPDADVMLPDPQDPTDYDYLAVIRYNAEQNRFHLKTTARTPK